ncbi:MAG: 3-deoxy-D-manno-octulosonic acid transferase, partial [Planctomycetaceae bacterium]|nr:3-deoxy-D-manno-octulosonic acid transferase [Planctomycetaceae bacterium]
DPEEAYALDTYQTLRKSFPNLRLVLVPRHQERFEEVARLVENRGLPLLKRSDVKQQAVGELQSTEKPVLLLDTLGELSACWGLAEVAFVGGSLTNRGGQNMIEPSAYGAGVLFGPNTRNFRDVVELLLSHNAARVVASPEDLTNCVQDWLQNPDEAANWGKRAQGLVLSQQGATAKTVQLLEDVAGQAKEQQMRNAA